MIDSGRPRGQRHSRNNPDHAPRVRQLSGIQARFVYEGELRGTWFPVSEALARSLPILPNPEFRVVRVEFRDTSDLS